MKCLLCFWFATKFLFLLSVCLCTCSEFSNRKDCFVLLSEDVVRVGGGAFREEREEGVLEVTVWLVVDERRIETK